MKHATLFLILTFGHSLVYCSKVQFSSNYEENLVQKVLQESQRKYDGKMELAFLNGAQSKRNHRELKKSTKFTQEIGRISNIYINAFKILINRHQMNHSLAITYLRQQLPKECEQQPSLICDSTSKYRTFNGTCNNLNNYYWGSINMPNARLIPPAYANGIDEPRGGQNQTRLPSSRTITIN
ncbi:unnamed protein product [Orchesella dallaii]|uniref:Uncharacterized protein n=1 Tax=Orchesella dallaii TaxID=48710 RepID=A0ABP1RD69_9HEXA